MPYNQPTLKGRLTVKLKTVLIVDDQESICSLVKASLENLWPTLKVVTCADSTRAMEKVKSLLPNLVILDVQMPEISGPDIAQAMKEHPDAKSIPIIFLTGILTPEEARGRADRVGRDIFIAKPINFGELTAAVEKYIQ